MNTNPSDTITLATVIIATRNKASYLELTLASLEQQSVPSKYWEVVVLDDASSDDTDEIIRRYANKGTMRLQWETSSQNRGRSGARNDALRHAQGMVVVFLDDDRIVRRDFLFWHLIHQLHSPQILIGEVQTYINTHISPEIDSRLWQMAEALLGMSFNFCGAEEHLCLPRRILEPADLDVPDRVQALIEPGGGGWGKAAARMDEAGVPYPPLWIFFTTGNASAPRSAIEAVGGFDESYTGWGLEDNDLCIRLQLHGLLPRYEERATTLHQRHPRSPNQREEYLRNFDRFMQKFPLADTAENRSIIGQFNLTRWIERQRECALSSDRRRKPGSLASPRKRILWCCPSLTTVGRSAAVAGELLRSDPGLEIVWISFGTAAVWLRQAGWQVVDMGAEASGSDRVRYDAYTAALKELSPDFALSDEESLLLPIAHYANVPCIYLTSRVTEQETNSDVSYLTYARRILVADKPGAEQLPKSLFARVDMCGAWVSAAAPNPDDRQKWRALFNALDRPMIVISQINHRKNDPEWVEAAVHAVMSEDASMRVVILSDPSRPSTFETMNASTGVSVLEAVPDAMEIMYHADAVIIPEEPALLWELAAKGVPTLVLGKHLDHGSPISNLVERLKKMKLPVTIAAQHMDWSDNELQRLVSRRSHSSPSADFDEGRRAAAVCIQENIF